MTRSLIFGFIISVSIVFSPVYSFEFFDGGSEDRVSTLLYQCELFTDADCKVLYDQSRKRVTPILEYVRTTIYSQDSLESVSMLESVKAIVPYLNSKQQTVNSEQKRMMIALLIVGFEDMVTESEVTTTSVYLANSQFESVQNNLLGNPILDELRQSAIKQLITYGFDGFITQPYASSLNILQTQPDNRQQRKLNQNTMLTDGLDKKLIEFITDEKNSGNDLRITKEDYESREGIYLFKNASDLESLGYHVVTHRSRTSTDAEYRRENIATAFREIGNLRVLNPGETISYLGDSNFDESEQQLYRNGTAIFLDEEIEAYGGGLCGGSTALYQGTFLNQSLTFTKRNHSKWYTNLYTAIINGEEISTPGIDSTIYSPSLDLKITNTAPYPVVVVMNYDGTLGGVEEVFTMSPNRGDMGTYRFVQSRPRSYSLAQKDGENRVVQGRCYEWEVNGELSTRCYKEVF